MSAAFSTRVTGWERPMTASVVLGDTSVGRSGSPLTSPLTPSHRRRCFSAPPCILSTLQSVTRRPRRKIV